eukprot:222926-Amphidinium_carterae.1
MPLQSPPFRRVSNAGFLKFGLSRQKKHDSVCLVKAYLGTLPLRRYCLRAAQFSYLHRHS